VSRVQFSQFGSPADENDGFYWPIARSLSFDSGFRSFMSFLRLDRAATQFVVRPLRQYLKGAQGIRIPILMYHRISSSPEPGAHPYFRLNTSAAAFEGHLRFLKDNQYSALTLDEAGRFLSTSEGHDRKYVAITFDDGYRDFYTDALPLLQKYGFTATVFLPTRYIDDRRQAFNQVHCLTWSEVRESQACGIAFGAHTVTHPQLAHLERHEVRAEVLRSKEQIECHLGLPVRSFSYPFQFPETDRQFISFLQRTLEQAGYNNGVSTIVGTATGEDNRFFLKRLPVNNDDDISLFRAKLRGDYDWVHIPQYLFKRIKHSLFYSQRSASPC
jgi:peptidoglycan/xylan/chitin deacetylase (PgdA/CDA1 family)